MRNKSIVTSNNAVGGECIRGDVKSHGIQKRTNDGGSSPYTAEDLCTFFDVNHRKEGYRQNCRNRKQLRNNNTTEVASHDSRTKE